MEVQFSKRPAVTVETDAERRPSNFSLHFSMPKWGLDLLHESLPLASVARGDGEGRLVLPSSFPCQFTFSLSVSFRLGCSITVVLVMGCCGRDPACLQRWMDNREAIVSSSLCLNARETNMCLLIPAPLIKIGSHWLKLWTFSCLNQKSDWWWHVIGSSLSITDSVLRVICLTCSLWHQRKKKEFKRAFNITK